MNKRKIGVLVSGRGSNLQALMDEIAVGTLNVEITVVISDKKDAFALERAAKAGIKTVAVERKECASKEEFENKITAALEDAGAELVVLAGFMRILSPVFVGHWHHKIVNIHPALLPRCILWTRARTAARLSCKKQCRCWTTTRTTRWQTGFWNRSIKRCPKLYVCGAKAGCK